VDREEARGYCSLGVRPRRLVIRFRSRLETLAIPIALEDLRETLLGSPGGGQRAGVYLNEIRSTAKRPLPVKSRAI